MANFWESPWDNWEVPDLKGPPLLHIHTLGKPKQALVQGAKECANEGHKCRRGIKETHRKRTS